LLNELIGKIITELKFEKDLITFFYLIDGEEKQLIIRPKSTLTYFYNSSLNSIVGKEVENISISENFIKLKSEGYYPNFYICGVKEITAVNLSKSKHELLIKALMYEFPYQEYPIQIHYTLVNGKWTYSEFANDHDKNFKEYFSSIDLPNDPSVRLMRVVQ
jgi:hypothetical protein